MSERTTVVHCMRNKYDIYIGRGRGGPWGSPFTEKEGTWAPVKVASKEEAIEKYREYILKKPELLAKLPELKGKVLGCWCAGKEALTTDDKPFRCHGQILAELVEERCGDE